MITRAKMCCFCTFLGFLIYERVFICLSGYASFRHHRLDGMLTRLVNEGLIMRGLGFNHSPWTPPTRKDLILLM